MSNSEDSSFETITLTGEDGSAYECRVLGVFELEGREYALLLRLPATGVSSDEGSTVVMRLIQQGDQAIFETISDDAEFGRVMQFVREVAREMDAESGGQ
jgi:hypothetical protein